METPVAEKGGRGKKPYYGSTVAIRVPQKLKDRFLRLVIAYKEAAKTHAENKFTDQLDDAITQVCYPGEEQSDWETKYNSLRKAVQVIQEKVVNQETSYKPKSATQLCKDIKALDLGND